ncbi:dimethylamine monooxygenase subunit DmmA family protein [uncultured Jatrophihabitans sp.]|uniref:dimethylamine monooxygenase subunit DmmA family protein n=1 Tax=uncultured Jatrophihabitans sp. TaxID=1610747 RepID=UPI0035C9F4EE
MIADHAAVPRWGVEPPDVDVSGRTFGVVGGDCSVTRRWARQIARLGRPCWQVDAAGDAGALDAALRDATVGLRVLIAGPEADVLAAAARCRAAGLADAELTLFATSARERRIYCAHCATTSIVDAQVEDVAPCGGCGRCLLVFAHLSARSGSYLAFQADAEDVG